MKFARLLLLILITSAPAYAELQLKPHPAFYELDGVRFSQVGFFDGDKEVTYTPPSGWECIGSGARLTLHPKDKASAEATVTKLAQEEEFAFDDETLEKLRKEALASVPGGSTDVQLTGEERSPVFVDGKETFLVTLSYTYYGDTYGRSLMFMNRGKEQIRFQLTARLSDFKDLQKAFLQSHFTWQGL
jgi:hypothetical protein